LHTRNFSAFFALASAPRNPGEPRLLSVLSAFLTAAFDSAAVQD